MKKRFKMPFTAFFWSEAARWSPEGLKIKPSPSVVIFLAVLMLIVAPFSTIHAQDHKTRTITFLSSGVKSSGISQSSAFDVSSYAEGQVFIDVTVEAGSSTLDITVQTSPDNATWYAHTTMTQITATGQYRAAITNFGNYLRIYYTVSGTSYTFSVVGVFKN